ncbi:MAG: DegV family EDD domain-containing protein [Clostridia bacterium]|nr:DegV family EDD domain-containing protein [Clostridia bacterium]
MEKYVILADITCDLSPEIREFVGMDDYIKGHVHINDGKGETDLITTLDWSEYDRAEFYKKLSDKKCKVTTSPANVEEYVAAFEKYVKDGYAVLSMSLSSKSSGTYDFTTVAARDVKEKYPEANIYCFDSMRISSAFGLLVMYAHLLKREGKSYEEVIEWLEANKQRVHQMGPIDDLITVARRGRLTMGKAIMGSFAGVKPMGDCNSEGYVTVLTKAKGIRKAFDVTVEYIRRTAVDAGNNYCIVANTDREEYAETLKGMLETELGFKRVFVLSCSSSNAVNIGPGMIGVYYFGEQITNLEAERAIMNAIVGK